MRGAGLPGVFAFDLRALTLAEGLRSGLVIGFVVMLAEWLHRPAIIWVALAAWLALAGRSRRGAAGALAALREGRGIEAVPAPQ
jgi:uncharacterized membrane protein YccC